MADRWDDLADSELRARLAQRTDRIRDAGGRPMYDADAIRRLVADREEPDAAELIDALLNP